MLTLAACLYVACFQACAIPAILRIRRRRSSDDLSIWRELLILAGASLQLGVMLHAGSPWQVWFSPVATMLNVGTLLVIILRYRVRAAHGTP
jgi:hypothetical protein